jgi:hypothetical protein
VYEQAGWRRTETSDQERIATKAHFRGGGGLFILWVPVVSSQGACLFRVSRLKHGLALSGAGRNRYLAVKSSMHFGYYLVIAALVLMGLEVLYALYQLATFL